MHPHLVGCQFQDALTERTLGAMASPTCLPTKSGIPEPSRLLAPMSPNHLRGGLAVSPYFGGIFSSTVTGWRLLDVPQVIWNSGFSNISATPSATVRHTISNA